MTELPIPAVLAVDVEPFTDEQLDAALSKSFLAAKGVLSEGHPSKFTVDNETVGEWAARKWAIENAEMERIRMQADEWRERITMWETAESLQAHGRRAFFEDRLTAFMARRRMESEYVKKDGTVDYRCKSVSLPSAVLKSSKRPARVTVAANEGAEVQAVEWAAVHAPDAVKRTLLVSGLKSVVEVKDGLPVTVDGEVVPGLTVEPESVTYKVTAS